MRRRTSAVSARTTALMKTVSPAAIAPATTWLAARVRARLDEPVADALRRRPRPNRLQLVAAAPVGHEPHVVTGHQPEVVPDPLRDGDLPLARHGRLDHGSSLPASRR